MAVKVVETGIFYKISLPRGIRTTLPKGEIVDITEDEIEESQLTKQVEDMKRRIEKAKERERLRRILSTRR
jgi:hypothetical protein